MSNLGIGLDKISKTYFISKTYKRAVIPPKSVLIQLNQSLRLSNLNNRAIDSVGLFKPDVQPLDSYPPRFAGAFPPNFVNAALAMSPM